MDELSSNLLKFTKFYLSFSKYTGEMSLDPFALQYATALVNSISSFEIWKAFSSMARHNTQK